MKCMTRLQSISGQKVLASVQCGNRRRSNCPLTSKKKLLGSKERESRISSTTPCTALPGGATDTGLLLAGLQDVLAKEPTNALSLPTWFVHTSSVIEWVIAMQLVLNFAVVTGKKEYVRLAYGMLPLHASSMCACTYHFFYNPPALDSLVTLQAALTCTGNVTLLLAAYSIYQISSAPAKEEGKEEIPLRRNPQQTMDDMMESDFTFFTKAVLVCFASAFVVKYGSLLVSLPFNPDGKAAASLVLIPTAILGADIARQDRNMSQKQAE